MQRLPEAHGSFLLRALPVLQAEPPVQAVIVSGSAVTGNMDEWSDLDLVVLVDDAAERTFTGQHFVVVQRLGTLLTAHRADHFGEPRLLICLYDAPLLHVDLKFMAVKDAGTLRYASELLWSRGEPPQLPAPAPPPTPDLQWYADRLPGWAHYMGTKLGRGELFEAMASLEFFRARFMVPLITIEAGRAPRGPRRLEETGSPRLGDLRRTYCPCDRGEILKAAELAFGMVQALLDALGGVRRHAQAEARAVGFLRGVGGEQGGQFLR